MPPRGRSTKKAAAVKVKVEPATAAAAASSSQKKKRATPAQSRAASKKKSKKKAGEEDEDEDEDGDEEMPDGEDADDEEKKASVDEDEPMKQEEEKENGEEEKEEEEAEGAPEDDEDDAADCKPRHGKGVKRGRSATPKGKKNAKEAKNSTLAVPAPASPSLRKSPRAAHPRMDLGFVVDVFSSSDEDEDDDDEEDGSGSDTGSVAGSRAASVKADDEYENGSDSFGDDDDDGDDDDFEDGPTKKSRKAASSSRAASTPKEKKPRKARSPAAPKGPKAPRQKKEPKPKKKKEPKPGAKKRLTLNPIRLSSKELADKLERVVDESCSLSKSHDVACCSRCSSREALRALRIGNLNLLESICDDITHVADPFLQWSPDVTLDAMKLAIVKGDRFFVRRLLHEINLYDWRRERVPVPAGEPDTLNPAARVGLPTNGLAKTSTGQASYIAYGHRVAQVNVSRGGKEGNNAFVCDASPNYSSSSSNSSIRYGHPPTWSSLFEDGLQHLVRYGTKLELLETFAQTLDTQRTKYVTAMATMKPNEGNSKPILQKQKSKLKDAIAAAAAAPNNNASDPNAADGVNDPAFDIRTREDSVHSWLSSNDSFHDAIQYGNIAMARSILAFSMRRSGIGGGSAGLASQGTSDMYALSRLGGINYLHAECLGRAELVGIGVSAPPAPAPGTPAADGPFSDNSFKAASATKKAGIQSLTPCHVAAINPDMSYLKKLASVLGGGVALDQVTTNSGRTPVFYAAVNSSPETLKWLIEQGCNIFIKDKQQVTPLALAIQAGAAHNIPLLVPQVKNTSYVDPAGNGDAAADPPHGDDVDDEDGDGDDDEDGPRRKKAKRAPPAAKKGAAGKSPALTGPNMPSTLSDINHKNKRTGTTHFHTACTLGNPKVVQALIDVGADILALDKEKRSGLYFACQQGHLEVVKVLYQHLQTSYPDPKDFSNIMKKSFLTLDKLGRTCLFQSVKNGHFEVVKYLLIEVGLPIDSIDSSGSNLIHYAASFGWSSILDLLLTVIHETGSSDLNLLPGSGNIWKTTPLFVAMLKNHLKLATKILENHGVDLDVRDSEGLTILHHVISTKLQDLKQCERQLKFLVLERSANVKLLDPKTQRNLLHLLCALPLPKSDSSDPLLVSELLRRHSEKDIEFSQLFLSKGLELDIPDGDGHTPMMLALKVGNLSLVRWLLSQGARVNLAYSSKDTSSSGDAGLTPIMKLLGLKREPTKRERDHLEDVRKRQQEKEHRERYYGKKPDDPIVEAEVERLHKIYLGWKKEADDAFELEKTGVLELMLENGVKFGSSTDPIDPPIEATKGAETTPPAPEESKEDDEDMDDEDEFDDDDEDDDDGGSRRKKAAPSSPSLVPLSLKSGVTTIHPLHYLNGRDSQGCNLLFHILRSPLSLSRLNDIFHHSLKRASQDSSCILDLRSRDRLGRTLLYHTVEHEDAIRLVKEIIQYAKKITSETNGNKDKKKKSTKSSSYTDCCQRLGLDCLTKDGDTLLAHIVTRSERTSSPVLAFQLIEILRTGGLVLSEVGPSITLVRKEKSPPNPPPADPAFPDRIPVKYEPDADDARRGGFIDGIDGDGGIIIEGDAARIRELSSQIGWYTITQTSFLTSLLGSFQTWSISRAIGRPTKIVEREQAAWIQIIARTCEALKETSPAILTKVINDTGRTQENVFHIIMSYVKSLPILPIVELFVSSLGSVPLFRRFAGFVDRGGRTPILALMEAAMPLPLPPPTDKATPIKPEATLKEIMKVDLTRWTPKDDEEEKKTDENKDTDANATGSTPDEDADSTRSQDEDEDNEDDDEKMVDGDDDDGDNMADDTFADVNRADDAIIDGDSSTSLPVTFGGVTVSIPPLSTRYVLTSSTVCSIIDIFLQSSGLSVNDKIQPEWHDLTKLNKRKKINQEQTSQDVQSVSNASEQTAAAAAVDEDSDYDSEAEDTIDAQSESTPDSSAPRVGSTPLSKKPKPRCQYWDKCYRKNPVHLDEFLHPNDLLAVTSLLGTEVAASASGGELTSDEEYILPDQPNLGQTMLHLAIVHSCDTIADFIVSKLDADVLCVDGHSRTPLLLAASVAPTSDRIPLILLSHGDVESQVLAVDGTGATPLSLIAQSTNKLAVAKALLTIQPKKQVERQDRNGRTPLHHAINYSARRHGDESARGYEMSFALENLLLESGSDINAIDADGRTPLHYVFVPIDQVYVTLAPGRANDPIELVSDICAVLDPTKKLSSHASSLSGPSKAPSLARAKSFIHKGKDQAECYVKVDCSDRWGRTPLAYAAQCGSQISVKYLVQRGASLRTVDLEGNGLFQHAIAFKQISLAVDLIDHGQDLQRPIYPYTQHIQLARQKLIDDVKTNGRKENINLQQIMASVGTSPTSGTNTGASSTLVSSDVAIVDLATHIAQLKLETISTFGFVLKLNSIGLAYLMMDQGLSLCLAIRDALDHNLLSLVWTLLTKTQPSKMLETDSFGTRRNLIHIIANFRPKDEVAHRAFEETWVKKWLDMIFQTGCGPDEIEGVFGWTPITFAAVRGHLEIVKWLLRLKVRTNVIGASGYTPAMEAVRHNQFEVLKLLFAHDPKSVSESGHRQAKDGTTMLHWAVQHANVEMVIFLLQHNLVDVNPKLDTRQDYFDPLGRWYSDVNINNNIDEDGQETSSIIDSIRHQREKVSNRHRFKHVLAWRSGLPNSMHPLSPLQIAIHGSQFDLIKILLAYGADPNQHVFDSYASFPSCVKSSDFLLTGLALSDQSRLLAILLHQPDPRDVELERKRLATVPIPPPTPPTPTQLAVRASKVKPCPNNFNLLNGDGIPIIQRIICPNGPNQPSPDDTQLLRTLVDASKNGFNIPVDLELASTAGDTAMSLAVRQALGKVKGALIQLGAKRNIAAEQTAQAEQDRRAKERMIDWSTFPSIDSAADAAAMEEQEEARLEAEAQADESNTIAAKVDVNAGDLVKTCIVYTDPSGCTYDLEMTFTEVNAGPYGKHASYFMQVLWNPLQQLPILFTRWGRVGEVGQFQQTPFSTLEQTLAEFKKIFKSKSGNDWDTNRTQKTFVAKENKYHLQFKKKVNATGNLLKSLATVIARVPPSELPPVRAPKAVQSLMKLLCDTSLIHQLMVRLGYSASDSDDEDAALAGKLTRAVLESAYEKLKSISSIIPVLARTNANIQRQYQLKQQMEYQIDQREREKREREQAKKDAGADGAGADGASTGMDIDEDDGEEKKSSSPDDLTLDLTPITSEIASLHAEKSKLDDELASLSNKFFQLAPQPQHRKSAIRSITTKEEVQLYCSQILQFLDLHVTKRLIIGCQLRTKIFHPIDYVYSGLGIYLSRLSHKQLEYSNIERYVYTDHERHELEIYNIFTLSRKGEEERFQTFQHLERTLLWHGSSVVNFNGILSTGLRIAPPEADVSGYAFGKGIYFADRFRKSEGYCRPFVGSFGALGTALAQPKPQFGYGFGFGGGSSNQNNNMTDDSKTKCLLLCEVALGTPYLAHEVEYMETCKPGTNSTKAIGANQPDARQGINTQDGMSGERTTTTRCGERKIA